MSNWDALVKGPAEGTEEPAQSEGRWDALAGANPAAKSEEVPPIPGTPIVTANPDGSGFQVDWPGEPAEPYVPPEVTTTIRPTTPEVIANEAYLRHLNARPIEAQLKVGTWGDVLTAFDRGHMRGRYDDVRVNGVPLSEESKAQYVREDQQFIAEAADALPGATLRGLTNFVPNVLEAGLQLATYNPWPTVDEITQKAAKDKGVEEILWTHTPATTEAAARYKARVRAGEIYYSSGELGVGAPPDTGDPRLVMNEQNGTLYPNLDALVVHDGDKFRVDTRALQTAFPGIDLTTPEGFKKFKAVEAVLSERERAVHQTRADESLGAVLAKEYAKDWVRNIVENPGYYVLTRPFDAAFTVLGTGQLLTGVVKTGGRMLAKEAGVVGAKTARLLDASNAAAEAGDTAKVASLSLKADKAMKAQDVAARISTWLGDTSDMAVHVDVVNGGRDLIKRTADELIASALEKGDLAKARSIEGLRNNWLVQIEDRLKQVGSDGIVTIKDKASSLLSLGEREYLARVNEPLLRTIMPIIDDVMGLKRPKGLIGRGAYQEASQLATETALTTMGKELGAEGTAIAGREGLVPTAHAATEWLGSVKEGDELSYAIAKMFTDDIKPAALDVYHGMKKALGPELGQDVVNRINATAALVEAEEAKDTAAVSKWATIQQNLEAVGYYPEHAKQISQSAKAVHAQALLDSAKPKLAYYLGDPGTWELVGAKPSLARQLAKEAGRVDIEHVVDVGRIFLNYALKHGRQIEGLGPLSELQALYLSGDSKYVNIIRRMAEGSKPPPVRASYVASRLAKIDKKTWGSPESVGEIFRDSLSEEIRRKRPTLLNQAEPGEVATNLAESIDALPTHDIALREADKMANVQKAAQRVVRGRMGLSMGKGPETPIDLETLYKATMGRRLESLRTGNPIVPSDVLRDAMFLAPESELGKAGWARVKATESATAFGGKGSEAGLSTLKPGAALVSRDKLTVAAQKGLTEAARVLGKEYIPNALAEAAMVSAYQDLIEIPRQIITERFDDLLGMGKVDPRWIGNLDKYVPELSKKYHDDTLFILTKWWDLRGMFGANKDRFRVNTRDASARGMVWNLLTRYHKAAMDMSQAAAAHRQAMDMAYFLGEHGLLRTGKVVDKVAIGEDNKIREVFRAVVGKDEEGNAITRDLTRLSANDLRGYAGRLQESALWSKTGQAGQDMMARLRSRVASRNTDVFFDDVTQEFYVSIPNDPKKYGDLAGTLVRELEADYLKYGDPLLFEEQARALKQSGLFHGLNAIGSRFKTAHVAAYLKSAERNVLMNAAYSLATPWGRGYFSSMPKVWDDYKPYIDGTAGPDNIWVRMKAHGIMDDTNMGAEGMETRKALGRSASRVQQTADIYGGKTPWKWRQHNREENVVHALGAPFRASDVYLKSMGSAYNIVEAASKGANMLAVEREIGLFAEAEQRILAAVGDTVGEAAVRDVMLNGVESKNWATTLSEYARARNIGARAASVELGLEVKSSKLVDTYRWFDRPGKDVVAQRVGEALKDPGLAAKNAAELIGFNYHKVNGLVRALRGPIGGAIVSPFITWSVKASKLGLQLMGAHPTETALLMQIAQVVDDVWNLQLPDDKRQAYAELAANLNSTVASQIFPGGTGAIETPGGLDQGVDVTYLMGLSPGFDLARFSPAKAGQFAGESVASMIPDTFRFSGWLGRPLVMALTGYDPLYKKEVEPIDVTRAIFETQVSPTIVKPASEIMSSLLGKTVSRGGAEQLPDIVGSFANELKPWTTRRVSLDKMRDRYAKNVETYFSAQVSELLEREEEIYSVARMEHRPLTEGNLASIRAIEAAIQKLDDAKEARLRSGESPGAQ